MSKVGFLNISASSLPLGSLQNEGVLMKCSAHILRNPFTLNFQSVLHVFETNLLNSIFSPAFLLQDILQHQLHFGLAGSLPAILIPELIFQYIISRCPFRFYTRNIGQNITERSTPSGHPQNRSIRTFFLALLPHMCLNPTKS